MYSALERSREICLPMLLTTDSIVSGLVGVGGNCSCVTSSLHYQTAPGHKVTWSETEQSGGLVSTINEDKWKKS